MTKTNAQGHAASHCRWNARNTNKHGMDAAAIVESDRGDRQLRELSVGDRVRTLDDGFQVIVGLTCGPSEPDDRTCPVTLEKGILGATEKVIFGPDQHVLIRGWLVSALYGVPEALVRIGRIAEYGRTRLLRNSGAPLLRISFDRPQVITCSGVLVAILRDVPFGVRSDLARPALLPSSERSIAESGLCLDLTSRRRDREVAA